MEDFLLFLAVGLLAQAVDGALGMAFGVISSTTLLAFGVGPAHASAAIHAAELFTTAASGSSHLYNRNIDWKLFWRLAPFGIVGGVLGTYVLTSFDGDVIKPFVTAYLALLGAWILLRSFRKAPSRPLPLNAVPPMGAVGGFLDSAGGGGWGPIVTTGLLGFGGTPRYVIGTVNAAEFLITLSVSLAFVGAILTGHWEDAGDLLSHGTAVAGLIVGGLIAAPFAGYVTAKLPERLLLRAVGVLISLLAGFQTGQALGWF
jgi:uncharacterized membrane protein YfcA